MKSVFRLIMLILLLQIAAIAQTTVTLTGSFVYPDQVGVNGRLEVGIVRNNVRDHCNGGHVVPTTKTNIQVINGVVTNSPGFIPSSCMTPVSLYVVRLYDTSRGVGSPGGRLLYEDNWLIDGVSPSDVGIYTSVAAGPNGPITVPSPVLQLPINTQTVLVPTGTTTYFQAGAATVVPLTIKGATSQSGNLQEWRSSTGTILCGITAVGAFTGACSGGGFTPPTGTGFIHVTSGSMDGAARAVDLSTADVTGNLGVTHLNSGTGATANTVWHGNATWSAINLAADVTGFLPVAHICTATNADASHFLRGDCTWQTVSAAAGGSDTQVQFNDSNALNGDPLFTWNTSTFQLTIGTDATLAVGASDGSVGFFCSSSSSLPTCYLRSQDGADPHFEVTDHALGGTDHGTFETDGNFFTQTGHDSFPSVINVNNAAGGTGATGLSITVASTDGAAFDTGLEILGNTGFLALNTLGTIHAGEVRTDKLSTTTNCANASGTCSSASAGVVSIAAAATTVTVATTAVTSSSRIFITENSTVGGALSVTCNTTVARTYAVSTITNGTSFVITSSAAPAVNPACIQFLVTN